MAASKFVLRVTKREPLIEYRPHSHHKLHLHNGIFDLSYSAFLWCENIVESRYHKVIDRIFSKKLPSFDERSRDAIPIVCLVETGLSDADRIAAFQAFHSAVDAGSPEVVKVDLNKTYHGTISSCQQLIYHILSDILMQPNIVRSMKKYSNVMAVDQIDSMFLFSRALESFEVIFDIIEQAALNNNPQLPAIRICITIGFLEGVSADAFNQFLQFIKDSRWEIQVIACCSSMSLARYEFCEQMAYGVRRQRHSFPSSRLLFDQVFEEVVVRSKLPFLLPVNLLRKLHKEFDQYTSCSFTFTRRIVSLIHHHCYQRQALLGMADQSGWLHKMNLDGSDSAEASTQRKVSKVLPFLQLKELPRSLWCGDDQRVSLPLLCAGLEAIWDFLTLARMLYSMLQTIKSAALDHATLSRFDSASIWVGLFDRSFYPRKSRVLNDLQGAVTQQLPAMSPQLLFDVLQEIERFLLSPQQHSGTVFYTESLRLHYDELQRGTRRLLYTVQAYLDSFTSSNLSLSSLSLQQMRTKMQQDAGLRRHLCEEVVVNMHRSGRLTVDEKVLVEARDGTSIVDARHRQLEDHSASIFGPMPERTQHPEREVPDQEQIAAATVDPAAAAALAAEDIASVPSIKDPSLPLSASVVLQCIVDDFATWLAQLLERYAALKSPLVEWEGIVVLDETADAFYSNEVTCDLREKFVEGLQEPFKKESERNKPSDVSVVSNGSSISKRTSTRRSEDDNSMPTKVHTRDQMSSIPVPDVCFLLEKTRTAAVHEHVNLWFEAFASQLGKRQARGPTGKLASRSTTEDGANKKTKKQRSNPDETTHHEDGLAEEHILQLAYADKHLRCRFINALYCLEQAGLISTSHGEKSGVRVTRQCFVGI